MEQLSAAKNRFHGTLDFSNLPQTLRSTFLWENRFTGEVVIPRILPAMESIDLARNCFSGEAVIGEIPGTLRAMHLGYNDIYNAVSTNGEQIVDTRVLLIDTRPSDMIE